MESQSFEEESIIKDVRNLFRLTKNLIILQLQIYEAFLDQKKKLKQLKIEYLEILRVYFEHEEKEN